MAYTKGDGLHEGREGLTRASTVVTCATCGDVAGQRHDEFDGVLVSVEQLGEA